MISTPERFEPATYRYVRKAAEGLPSFSGDEEKRQLVEILLLRRPLSDIGPDLVEFFGEDRARSLAGKIRELAKQDSSGDRIAKAAIRWADGFDRRLVEGDFPKFMSTENVASRPQFVGTTVTRLPSGVTSIEYHYR